MSFNIWSPDQGSEPDSTTYLAGKVIGHAASAAIGTSFTAAGAGIAGGSEVGGAALVHKQKKTNYGI